MRLSACVVLYGALNSISFYLSKGAKGSFTGAPPLAHYIVLSSPISSAPISLLPKITATWWTLHHIRSFPLLVTQSSKYLREERGREIARLRDPSPLASSPSVIFTVFVRRKKCPWRTRNTYCQKEVARLYIPCHRIFSDNVFLR